MSAPLNQFWLRKLHSLSGFLFAGLFLVFHFFNPGMNVFSRGGFLSILLLFSLPLVFHGLYGAYIVYEGQVQLYGFLRNGHYLLQRASGLVVFVFLPVHVYIMRTAPSLIDLPAYEAFWLIGVFTAVYHLSNGVFGVLVHWGITIGVKAQRAGALLTAVLFVLFSIAGLNAFSVLTGRAAFLQALYRLLIS